MCIACLDSRVTKAHLFDSNWFSLSAFVAWKECKVLLCFCPSASPVTAAPVYVFEVVVICFGTQGSAACIYQYRPLRRVLCVCGVFFLVGPLAKWFANMSSSLRGERDSLGNFQRLALLQCVLCNVCVCVCVFCVCCPCVL